MKLSDIYKLPMVSEYDCIIDKGCRYKIDFYAGDSNCEEQVRLVAKAINHHDALVKALRDLIDNSSPLANMQYHSRRKSAIDLLTTINNKDR